MKKFRFNCAKDGLFIMKVLIACEESQIECLAFHSLGHEVYSCDLQKPSGGHPELHILGDVLQILQGGVFATMDGVLHKVSRWDLIIAHPPCTYLSNAGACRLYPSKGQLDFRRFEKGLAAKEFFMKFYNAECDRICIENPIPSLIFGLPHCSQYIQPFEFGHPFSKKTCLWLRGLPLLRPTNIIKDFVPYISCGTSHNKGNSLKSGFSRSGGSSRVRSRSFSGVAAAMACQWSNPEDYQFTLFNWFV